MARKIFLDIETLPPNEDVHEDIFRQIQQAQIEKKKPVSNDEITQLADEQFRDLALHAERGRLLTIGILFEENGRIVHHGLLGRDPKTGNFHLNEKQTLKAFWHLVKSFNPNCDLFIGHNILDFDLPFLFKRSVIHCVKPSINISFRRYQKQPIFDTMWEWSCWRHRISLDELATSLNIESPKQGDINGSKIYDYFLGGRHSDIALYCMKDVESTREVYYRLNFTDPPFLVSYAKKNDFALTTLARNRFVESTL